MTFVTSTDGEHTVWVVGNRGTILKSDDSGEAWTESNIDTNESLRSVTFMNGGQTGWTVGTNGIIFKSENGGDTWESVHSEDGTILHSVTFTEEGNTVWAVGAIGTIFKSDDGGNSWNLVRREVDETLRSITFSTDGQTGWIVGVGTVVKSIDGGETWISSPNNVLGSIESGAFAADGRTGLVAGRFGTILKSIDGGETWKFRVSTGFRSLTFTDGGRTGWAAGPPGVIVRFSDEGKTQVVRDSGSVARIESIVFTADGQTGWGVGENGGVVRSTDGGNSWEISFEPGIYPQRVAQRRGGRTFYDFVFIIIELNALTCASDVPICWGVGTRGTIVKWERGNAGDGWVDRETRAGTAADLRSVTFTADGQTGWAVGTGGLIVKTENAGDDWVDRESGTAADLRSVAFTADGQTGWAVGTGGLIVKSDDGGDNWAIIDGGIAADLRSVTFAVDGQTGWAVGTGGAIVKTENAGEDWAIIDGGTAADLRSVMFAGDEQTVWILGDDLIQFSNDGGENWEQLEYQVRAAPWVWSTFVLALLLLGFSFRPLTVSVSSGADEFASDRPVDDGDPDLLHRGRTARALSRFLRNESTEAPLTVAITGDWGQGKSSLMNLAAADLKRHRSRVILFNAWHHQKERHLFAALLQAVRKQAIPKLWEPYGVWFRIRLVLSRWRRLAFSLILLALAFFARLAVDERLGEDVAAFINERLGGAVTDIFENSLRNAGAVIAAIALIAAIERAFVAVVADLERTGLDPGRLMSRAAGAFRVKASGERLAFRQRFIDAFAEVTNALSPCTPLIVIDDLDRCRPEQVVETLEAVNFLVNAAPCYVVMGFAPEQVIGCVELRYKDIAQQLSMPRSVYARQCLTKLVNIEIAVPRLTDADAEKLVRPDRPEDDLNRQTDKETLNDKILMSGVTALRYFNKISWVEVPRRLAKILMVCTVAISLGAVGTSSVAQQWLQNFMASGASESAPGASESAPGASESAPGASESAPGASESAPGASESAPEGSPGTPEEDRSRFRPGADTEVFWWGYLPFGLVVVFIALQAVMLHSRRLDHTQDSEDFSEALIIWLRVVRAWVNSPRQVKRFVNRVRYLAMALSPEPETRMEGFERWLRGWIQRRSETPLEDFARWLRDWIQGRSETLWRALSGESRKGSKTVSVDGSDDKSRETSTQDLSEPLIIALAALQSLNSHVAMTDDGIPLPPGLLHVFSHQQGDAEQESEFEKWKKALAQKAPAGKNVLGELDKAISEHLEKFKDELDEGKKKRFLDVADGIVLN